jgi:uncharacterized protein (TIGR02246 family)
VNQNPADIATTLAKALEAGWDAGDSEAFCAPFADFVDFVDIRAEYHRGRRAIQYGHAALFESIFKGSINRYEVINARFLSPNMIAAQVAATLIVPQGPMAGENHATLSFVARQKDGAWRIEVFHNTLAQRELDADEKALRERIR